MLFIPINEKQDPRVTRTRNLILQAFMALLKEKGFQALSVQNIAERAGINRATFYAHFADKFALLDFSIRQTFQQELEKRTLSACHFSEENLHALIVVVCEFITNAHGHCSHPDAQFESLVESQVKRQLQELLQLWLEQGVSQVDAKSAATAASWAIYGLALQWSREKGRPRPPAEHFASQILPLVLRNLDGL